MHFFMQVIYSAEAIAVSVSGGGRKLPLDTHSIAPALYQGRWGEIPSV